MAKIIKLNDDYGKCECGSTLMHLVVDPPGSWQVVAIQCAQCGEFVCVDVDDDEEIICLIDDLADEIDA